MDTQAAGMSKYWTSEQPKRFDDLHSCEASADGALEAARNMPPGPERNDALKAAGMLRNTADAFGLIFAKRGRPSR
jgi:hypothetical protein